MNPLFAIIRGHFTPRSLRVYLACLTLYFGLAIFVCWLMFPVENAFSILTHTFSYLGSFNEDRNPVGWWLFCVAMTGWGLACFPLVLYSFRRLAPIAYQGARIAALLLFVGCTGIVIVGLFPDARDPLAGWVRWTTVHYAGAAVLVLGFVFGVPCQAVLVFRAARDPRLDGATRRAFRRARWPQLFFITEAGVALFFLIRWLFVYETLRAEAQAAGLEIGSSWREAMNTPYSFPLWDNLFVYTLFIYFIWTALALPAAIPRPVEAPRT